MILVACEESQRVAISFRELGFEAYSCDIEPCSGGHPEWHIQDDVVNHLEDGWELMIAHPPCTYLTNAGIGWFNIEKYGEKAKLRHLNREVAFEFFLKLANANIPHIAVENPVGYVNSHWRKPDQIIHPFHFGEPERKPTCLWLKGLPLLEHTEVVVPRVYGTYKTGKHKGKKIYWNDAIPERKGRSKERSKTFWGIARAMASQWSEVLNG